MKFFSLMRGALFAAIMLAIFLAPVAHAQDAGNVRVVRLSLAEGQVLVSHPGSNVWEEASVNLPLEEGDTLATEDGRTAIEFENGATAYLAENTVLQFTQLNFSGGGRATDLTLSQGAGNFYANLTSQDSFRVQAITFDVTIPQRAEFRVDGFKDGAAVQVLTGDVSVSTTKGSTNLEKGQSVAVHEKDFQDFSIGSLPIAEDDFDQWVTEQGEMIRAGNKNTLSYINSPNIYGLSDLSRYGTFVNIAGFGFSWRPFSVGFTWTPYFNGRWALTSNLGWIWVSSEPWGWLPYHFGSWLLSPNLGWVWVPGGPAGLRQWEPSRVNWVTVGNQVGWVAKSPNDRVGAPANAAQGIITKSGRSPRNGIESHEIVTGKDLRTITPLKQPPPEFASRPAPGPQRSGIQSTSRIAPRTPVSNDSIVYDHGTHTYINSDGRDRRDAREEHNGNPPVNANRPPVAPAALMPRSSAQSEIPRVTPPSTGRTDSRTNRVMLPPPYPTAPASRGVAPQSGMLPARPQINGPLNMPPRPFAPPPVAGSVGAPGQRMPGSIHTPSPSPEAPRAVAPAAQPGAPRAGQSPIGSATRPATQTPPASANRH